MDSVLFVGAHPDDVETGALGLLFGFRDVKIHYVVMSKCMDIPRNQRILEEYGEVTKRLSAISRIFDLPNRALSVYGKEMREILEGYRDDEQVRAVVCPSINDIHQDHKAVADEVIRVFRRHTVLFYELAHSCPLFEPRLFIPLEESRVKQKLELISLYQSQRTQRYMQEKVILATMQFRGFQCGCDFAEAFEIWRIIGGLPK